MRHTDTLCYMSDRLCEPSLHDVRSHYLAGRFEQAADLYRDYLHDNPRDCEALRALGTICFQNGQLERAQYFFGEAARLNPSSLDALRLRGAVLMQLGGVLAEFGE